MDIGALTVDDGRSDDMVVAMLQRVVEGQAVLMHRMEAMETGRAEEASKLRVELAGEFNKLRVEFAAEF